MPSRSRNGVLIALVVFVAIAIALRLFGGPIYKALLAMHGR
jgi:hypothetical protein